MQFHTQWIYFPGETGNKTSHFELYRNTNPKKKLGYKQYFVKQRQKITTKK